jgi:uncharacterized RDD family membrane protein YckC
VDYTRSFGKRLGAAAIDLVFAHLVVVLVFGWWAMSLDSPLRFNGSLLNFETCQEGTPKADSPFAQWSKVNICTTKSDFILPSKELVLQKIDQSGSITYIQEARFFLNASNQVTAIIRLDYLMFLVWWLGASICEASGWQASPGKRLFGLEVENISGRAHLSQTLVRNGLKLLLPLIFMMVQIVDDLYFRSLWFQAVAAKGIYTPLLPVWWHRILLALYGVAATVNAINIGSIMWPVKAMGRGLYDRFAGTRVVMP